MPLRFSFFLWERAGLSYTLGYDGPCWKIKKNEWTEDTVRALPFFEELRVMFTSEELFQQFPILSEHYLRSEISQRLAHCSLRTPRAEFHIQALCNYLEVSNEGLFVIDRHLPPDLAEDRAILRRDFDRLLDCERS